MEVAPFDVKSKVAEESWGQFPHPLLIRVKLIKLFFEYLECKVN